MTRPANKLPALKASTSVSNVIDNVCNVAISQVGYREGYQYGHWNNDNIYSTDINGWNGYAYCVDGVNWSVIHAGYESLIYRTSSCSAYYKWAVAHDLIGNDGDNPPKRGDFIDFTGGSTGHKHFGLIIEVHDTWLDTVEWNTNVNGSAEGDGCHRMRRPRANGAYDTIRLPWSKVVVAAPKPAPTPGVAQPHDLFWDQLRWQAQHKKTPVYTGSVLALKKALKAAGYKGTLNMNATYGWGLIRGVRWAQEQMGDTPDKGIAYLGEKQLETFCSNPKVKKVVAYGGKGSLVATKKKKG